MNKKARILKMLILGNQHVFIKESLGVEFKEFCLNEINFSHRDVNSIVKNGIINKEQFNENIYNNIAYYFYKYVPKYISAYINSNINGNLIFGVNDFGEITGIPFFGTKIQLEEYVNNINYKKYLKNLNESNDINITVEKLKIDKNYLSNISEKLLKEYYSQVKKKNEAVIKYKNERIKWANEINQYTCRLSDLLTNKKYYFHKYLEIHAPHMLNYTIKEHEMRNISHLKIDSSHYIYWLMQFKDEHLNRLKKNKPEMPNTDKISNSPMYLFKHLTNLRLKMINSNTDLNFFLIKIKILKNIQQDVTSNKTLYYNIRKNIWITNYRKLYKEEPACVSI